MEIIICYYKLLNFEIMLDVNLFFCFNPLIGNVSELPSAAGNYLVVLRPSCLLPAISIKPIISQLDYNGEKFDVIYTGISENLKQRDYRQHFTGNNAGRSTLRKSLGCLMRFKQIPRDRNRQDNGKTKFSDEDESILSKWMAANLLLFYYVNDRYEENELELIECYNPPLNLKNNKNFINREFRSMLSDLRSSKKQFEFNIHSILSDNFISVKKNEKNMKGKRIFTENEKKELVVLIREKCNLPSNKQKSIRDKMRSIGFYATDFGVTNVTVEKFKELIRRGEVEIKNVI